MDVVTALTPREWELLRLSALGRSNREIAHDLDLSLQTVKNHLAAVRRKSGGTTLVEVLATVGWLHVPDDKLMPAVILTDRVRRELVTLRGAVDAELARLTDHMTAGATSPSPSPAGVSSVAGRSRLSAA